jgi:hypothetical protein
MIDSYGQIVIMVWTQEMGKQWWPETSNSLEHMESGKTVVTMNL